MRIVGGAWRGRAIQAPEGRNAVRPTSDRTRESVFNVLAHSLLGSLEGLKVLDAFAGTGALGLEALSRGAAHVTFMEKDRSALAVLRQNITALGCGHQAQVSSGDSMAPAAPSCGACDLVFLDPPYDADLLLPSLSALQQRGWLADGAIVVCEHRFTLDLDQPPPRFTRLDQRRYGKTKITFLRHDPFLSPPLAPRAAPGKGDEEEISGGGESQA